MGIRTDLAGCRYPVLHYCWLLFPGGQHAIICIVLDLLIYLFQLSDFSIYCNHWQYTLCKLNWKISQIMENCDNQMLGDNFVMDAICVGLKRSLCTANTEAPASSCEDRADETRSSSSLCLPLTPLFQHLVQARQQTACEKGNERPISCVCYVPVHTDLEGGWAMLFLSST